MPLFSIFNNVEFLLGPGIDSHSYEPSAADLTKIQEAGEKTVSK